MWTVWDLKPHRKEEEISGYTRETGPTPAKNVVAGQAGGDVGCGGQSTEQD